MVSAVRVRRPGLRAKAGGLDYTLRTSFSSDLGDAEAAVVLPHRTDVALGNGAGRVLLVDPGRIGGAEAMTGHIGGPLRTGRESLKGILPPG